ncbi:MAG: ABC transporter ATP-binding protein [Parahaliea sp.]
MTAVIEARKLSRRFAQITAIDGIDLTVQAGGIVGLIGPNGAGKTTLLRALLGLTDCEGKLSVLGLDPRRKRSQLMEEVCFIADTAVLPRWMTVGQLLDYTAGIHSRFDFSLAQKLLADTEVGAERNVAELSKGMVVQLHLALVMAVDARLLILDEPTLGLDLLFRKRFYEQLLNDYFDGERTIIVSTHQVEEIEHILSEVLFMDCGRLVLRKSMDAFEQSFTEVHVAAGMQAKAQEIPHLGQRSILGGKALIYEDVDRTLLTGLGELRTPSVADVFVACIEGERGNG